MTRHLETVLTMLLAGALGASEAAPRVDAPAIRLDPRTPYFRHASDRLGGDRGEAALDVSVAGACGAEVWAFERAELLIRRSRFAEATLVSVPRAGCVACDPVVVRWQHEPTGHLEFAVNIHRRRASVPC